MTFRLAFGALLISVALTAWWSTSDAQNEDACRSDCRVQEQQCMEACGEHSNPVECDADCRDQAQDCHAGCN